MPNSWKPWKENMPEKKKMISARLDEKTIDTLKIAAELYTGKRNVTKGIEVLVYRFITQVKEELEKNHGLH